MELLNAMMHILRVNSWERQKFDECFKHWIQLLLALVDYSQSPHVLLQQLLVGSPNNLVVVEYGEYIKNEVSS